MISKKLKNKSFLVLIILALVTVLFFNSMLTAGKSDQRYKAMKKEDRISVATIKNKLMLIPLDDRPINYTEIIKMSEVLNIDLLIPKHDALRTDYIGLASSTDFPKLNYGNTADIKQWILDNLDQADAYVLSLDMLSRGGLVGSRSNHFDLDEIVDCLSVVEVIKEKYPDKKIYAFDSVMRLAETSTSNVDSLADYYISRIFGMLCIEEFEKDGLIDEAPTERLEKLMLKYKALGDYSFVSVESIYEKSKKMGIDIALENIERWKRKKQKPYMESRIKSLLANSIAIEYTKEGMIDYLIFGVDDSSAFSIQDQEIDYINKTIENYGLEENAIIFDGTDECMMMLLSRYAKELNLDEDINIRLSLYGDVSKVAPFERLTVIENLERHIEAIGAKTSTDEYNMDLIMITEDAGSIEQIKAYKRLRDNYENRIPTMIIDRSSFNEISYFSKKLLSSKKAAFLFGYSGWNTNGNSIGISLSMGLGRYSVLNSSYESTNSSETTTSHLEYLANRISKDLIIRNGKRLLKGYDSEEPDEFANVLEDELSAFLKNSFDGSTYMESTEIISSRPKLDVEQLFPWHRTFDVNIDFDIEVD